MTFSVVVTTYNRAAQLAECLEALARLGYPRERYEVIVVDDGGEQPLDAVAERFAGRMNVWLLRQANGGPASGRNYGARVARGDLLAFTDDDCVAEPQWLKALERRLAGRADCAAGGRIVNGLPEDPQSSVSQLNPQTTMRLEFSPTRPAMGASARPPAAPSAAPDGVVG